MSDDQRQAHLHKLPFYLADLALSGVAVFVLWRLGHITGSWELAAALGCLAAAGFGAWMSIIPWLAEYRRGARREEQSELASTLEQIGELQSVAGLIRGASGQWQGVQEAATRTAASAEEIARRMKAETEDFMKFLERANEQERAGMRLEIEKLRRMEGDWLKVSVQMLDHTFAVSQAALRSGQQGLINQLHQFQNACRDAARRMGLAPFVPQAGDLFDPQAHQLPDPKANPPESAMVGDVLATGYTYQGQLLRRALVTLAPEHPPRTESLPEPAIPEPATESPDESFETIPQDSEPLENTTIPENSNPTEQAADPAEPLEEPAQKKSPQRRKEANPPGEDTSEPQLRLI